MRTLSLTDYPSKVDDLSALLIRVRNKDKDAIDTMILGHVRLVISAVNRYIDTNNCSFLGDELDSVAMEALVTAVNKVASGEMTKHDNITGYILNFVHSYLSNALRDSSVVHFPRNTERKTILPLIEELVKGEENEVGELVEEVEVGCSKEEAQILELRRKGYNDSEISETLDLSRLKIQRIRSKLKKNWEKRNV